MHRYNTVSLSVHKIWHVWRVPQCGNISNPIWGTTRAKWETHFNYFFPFNYSFHTCEDMGTDHLSITYHIPKEFTKRPQRCYFPCRGQCTDEKERTMPMTQVFPVVIEMILNKKKKQHKLWNITKYKHFQNRHYYLELEWKQ